MTAAQKTIGCPGFQAAAGEPSRPHQSTEASLSSCERRQSLHRFQRFPENGVQSTNQKKRIARSKTYHWGLLLHQKTTNRKNKSASLLHGVVMTGKLYRKLNISQPFTSKIYSPWSRYDELIEMAQVVPHRRPCIRSHSPTALRTFQGTPSMRGSQRRIRGWGTLAWWNPDGGLGIDTWGHWGQWIEGRIYRKGGFYMVLLTTIRLWGNFFIQF